MISHGVTMEYLEKVINDQNVLNETLNKVEVIYDSDNYIKEMIDIIQKDRTKTIEVNIINSAKAKFSDDNREAKRKCEKDLGYALSILGKQGVEHVIDAIDDLMDNAIFADKQKGLQLYYTYYSIEKYQRAYRLMSIMVCNLMAEYFKENFKHPFLEKVVTYLKEDAYTEKYIQNFEILKDIEKTEELIRLLRVINRACTYHDIGMCVISGIIQEKNLENQLIHKFQQIPYNKKRIESLPIESGVISIEYEKNILNCHHEMIGYHYLKLSSSANKAIYENAIKHHSSSDHSFSKLIDIAHSIASKDYNAPGIVPPSWGVFTVYVKNPSDKELHFQQIKTIQSYTKKIQECLPNE